uniref:Uncharacterized protein n=1 Tax=Acrobeloides nanus TaxID=290746 RepID=A0A914CDS1_9BILA
MNQVQRLTKPILSIPPTSRWRLRSEPPGIPYQIPDKETYAVPGWLLAQTLSEKKLAYATHVEKMKKLLEHKIEPAPPNFTPIQTFDPARIEKAKVVIEKRMKVT